MKAKILKSNEADEFETDERCSILELSNDPDDPEISIARARVAPSVTTAWHKLTGVAERYVILEGEGLVEVGELDPAKLGPGDVVRIPPEIRQRITNTGDTDLIFHAICTPRFTPECYVDLEKNSIS
ncbi:MAG: cupin domain-containing protein [Opitutaceae bacterium]